MAEISIPLSEYAERRASLRRALKSSVGVVFAGEPADPLHGDFRAHPHFEYLTGMADEHGAILVLDPANPVENLREILVLRPLNPELEKWDGLRLGITKALKDKTGFKVILRYDRYPRALADAVRRTKSVACLHPLAWHTQPVTPDLALFKTLAARIPDLVIEDRTEAVALLRSVKSKHEVAMIQQAIDITAAGFEALAKALRPGIGEFDAQETLEHAYRTNGSRGTAFGTIAGAGLNSTVLHYRANDRTIEKGDLVCVDSGARFGGYGADITRTFPADGRFSTRQREVYDVVLAANEAAIRAVKPGVRIADIDKVARAIITRAGLGDYFIHGIGHHLGLETHDITPDASLEAGNVITIEPGVYLPDEALGVRIEDDVLVTKDGRKNLSAKIPKRAADVESLMAG
jgi:Xaa-Pro aminopeptidase